MGKYTKTGSFVMLLHLRRAGMIKPTDSFIGKELFGLGYNEAA